MGGVAGIGMAVGCTSQPSTTFCFLRRIIKGPAGVSACRAIFMFKPGKIDSIVLASENPEHPDFELDGDEVISIYLITEELGWKPV